MRTRDDVMRVRDDMGTSGTLIYNLDYVDPISEIDLLFEATNGASHNKENPLEWCVSKIELVDGSDVLYSMPADLALAVAMHLRQKETHAYRTEAASDTPYISIPICFGRYLYDPVLSLNPNAFRNLQLRVTFDEATIRAAGATGYVSDSMQLSIQAKLMEDADAPRGFLMTKDVYDFTTVASGDERVDMPTDYPWRVLFARVYESEVDLRSSVTNYELNCDGGKFIPFDKHARYVVDKMAEVFNPLQIDITAMVSNASYTETFVGIDRQGSVCAGAAGYIIGASSFWPAACRTYVAEHDGTAANNVVCRIVTSGWAIHNTLLIPFGRLMEIAEWFDAPQHNNVRFYLTQGNAGAEVNVGVQQLRMY